MSNPDTPASNGEQGSSSNNSTSLSVPATPQQAARDPCILWAARIRGRSSDNLPARTPEHQRNVSDITVTPANASKLEQGILLSGGGVVDKEALMSGDWRRPRAPTDPFSRGGDSSASSSASTEGDGVKSPVPQPREDRDASQISAENAQGFFKAGNCVFVANLALGAADQELEAEVYNVFVRFGELYTKIRRDRNGMPYAFCQFTKDEDANKALASGHGLQILGRPCRVERARANRSVYLSRTAGGPISKDQAREVLGGLGALEKLWFPTDTDKEVYRLADGIWATFSFFQDARDAQNSFKDSKEYRLEVPYAPEDHDRYHSGRFRGPPIRATPLRSVRTMSVRWSATPSRSSNTSIFVGNLPPSTPAEALYEIFETCGSVRAIEIHLKSNGTSGSTSTYAFVEFTNEFGARNALSQDCRVNGRRLRVEVRETEDHSSRRFSSKVNNSPVLPMTPKIPRISDSVAKAPTMAPIVELPPQPAPGASPAAPPQTPSTGNFFSYPPFYGAGYNYGSYYPPPSASTEGGQSVTSANAQTPYGYGYMPPPPQYGYSYVYAPPTSGEQVAPTNGHQTTAPVNTTPTTSFPEAGAGAS